MLKPMKRYSKLTSENRITVEVEAEESAIRPVGAALMAAALALPLSAQVHAETAPENGLISLKHLDYQDYQPGIDRIRVKATALQVIAPIAEEWAIGGSVVTDSISGASPAFHTSAITKLKDFRRAGDVDVTRYFQRGSINIGVNISGESDYLSRGLSAQGSLSSEDKNTTWTAGFGVNNDDINPNNHIVSHEHKRTADFLLGVTQILTPDDIVQFTLGYSDGNGYFSDPYKFLDSRPRSRDSTTLLARWNHYLNSTRGILRISYRYYSDNWSIHSHTFNNEYVQELPGGWTITPFLRLYTQTKARFYIDADPSILPFAPSPPPDAVFHSEDQRLANFGALT
ncbi:DUF3570 domain-containing protein [Undibacterium terreum]|uniref:DUF3570 domain-containing protein n=1 Tax=Undibacterium terreum TaxID=1224302 RepID=A0A916UZI4_9BURK|nr:DUF3570 domain-containing protein [Undibacterium terreum]GGC96732.1 hypothetical protein GCM10011396_50210 [Undibacterium terreum]